MKQGNRWRSQIGAASFVLSIFGLVLLFAYRYYLGRYFFLFDDYALLDIASNQSLEALFKTPQIGFYRPLTFAFLKFQFYFFGWDYPSLYVLVGFTIHMVNAGFVFRLANGLLNSPRAALMASGLFVLSPWAGETLFWMSCQFDILAVHFLLLTLLASSTALNLPDGRSFACRLVLIAVLGTLAALCKENSVVLPLLLGALFIRQQIGEKLLTGRAGAVLGAGATGTGIYLVTRAYIMPLWSGAYGSYDLLMQGANLSGLLTPIVYLPAAALSLARLMHIGYVLAIGVLFVLVLLSRKKLALRMILSFSLAFVPLLWVKFLPFSTAGERLVYLPSVFLCIYMSLSVSGDAHPGRLGSAVMGAQHWRRLSYILLTSIIAYGAMSMNYQRNIWISSCRMARQSIETFGNRFLRYSNRAEQYYIRGLPYVFIEGPYIMKAYAFKYYFQKPFIKIGAEACSYSYNDGWPKKVGTFKDPHSDIIDAKNPIIIEMPDVN